MKVSLALLPAPYAVAVTDVCYAMLTVSAAMAEVIGQSRRLLAASLRIDVEDVLVRVQLMNGRIRPEYSLPDTVDPNQARQAVNALGVHIDPMWRRAYTSVMRRRGAA